MGWVQKKRESRCDTVAVELVVVDIAIPNFVDAQRIPRAVQPYQHMTRVIVFLSIKTT
jgi:hypothetical protein